MWFNLRIPIRKNQETNFLSYKLGKVYLVVCAILVIKLAGYVFYADRIYKPSTAGIVYRNMNGTKPSTAGIVYRNMNGGNHLLQVQFIET